MMKARQKRVVFSLLALVLALVVAGFWAHRAWQDVLRESGIERLQWQGLTLSGTHLQLAQLSLTRRQTGQSLNARFQKLRLNWQWRGLKPHFTQLEVAQTQLEQIQSGLKREARLEGFSLTGGGTGFDPPFQRLHLEQLTLGWQPASDASSRHASDSSGSSERGLPPLPESLPDWLPRHIDVPQFSARLPCKKGACLVSGGLSLQWRTDSRITPVPWETIMGQAELHLKLPEPWALPLGARLEGELDLALALKAGRLKGKLTDTRLSLQLPQWTRAGWQLQGLQADLALSGEAGDGRLTFGLGEGSNLQLARLRPAAKTGATPELRMQDLQLDLQDLEVSAHYEQDYPQIQSKPTDLLTEIKARGPVALNLGELQAPYLAPQAWHLTGEFSADSARVRMNIEVRNRAELGLDLTLDHAFGGALTAEAQFAGQGEATARALAQTFPDWPGELTVSEGRLEAQARLEMPPEAATRLDGGLRFESLGGIYDRTAWAGLTGPLNFELRGEQLSVRTAGLHLDSLNPGLPMGPLQLAGDYRATLAEPLTGLLALGSAQMELLGGELWLQPGRWELADRPLRFPFEFKELDLGQLLQAYPAEGLAASGRLSGELPVLIDRQGLHLAQGRVTAREPGGRLALPADSVQALSRASQPTQLVAQALQDFHYSVLTSRIDYNRDGTLLLGLRLEGKSPNIESDRPVILNINLEENLPALLTSLQLSGRVNEAVTRKVRELMRQEEQTP